MILEHRTREVDASLRLVQHDGEGYLMVMAGERCIASESDADLARCARFAMEITQLRGARVAIIGGGFCILPRLLFGRGYLIDVYELEPALDRYCPVGARFIPGDYVSTLSGKYDAIVYDIGDPPDIALLEQCLAAGGQLLGVSP